MTKFLSLAFLLLALPFSMASGLEVQSLFQRLTGHPLLKSDSRYAEIESFLKQGKLLEAAQIASNDSGFYNLTVRDWAAVMSNRSEIPTVPLNDFIALAIGVTRDGADARLLLTGNFRYQGRNDLGLSLPLMTSNAHYLELDARKTDLRESLIKVEPQWSKSIEAAGLLTTRGWAEAHYMAGTNRRATEFMFREFLCAPIEKWKTSGLDDFRVRRDVDRNPGGDPSRYQSECRTCHAAMDGFSGAFASVDFNIAGGFYYSKDWTAPKYNQNKDVYPKGHATQDSTWVNLLTSPSHQGMFGWRGTEEGVEIHSLGELAANSRGFSSCMVKRVFRKVCRRELSETEASFLETYSTQFEADGYNLKKLFERIAITGTCYGE